MLTPHTCLLARLQRTSVSVNIKERLDFSCALFGPDGALVANAPHLPVHLGAMSEAVRFQVSERRRAAVPCQAPSRTCHRKAAAGQHAMSSAASLWDASSLPAALRSCRAATSLFPLLGSVAGLGCVGLAE